MRKIKICLILMILAFLGCACSINTQDETQMVEDSAEVMTDEGLKESQITEEQFEKVSNQYETETLMAITFSEVEFQIPEGWDDSKKEKGDWTYYYYNNLMLSVNVIDENKYINDDLLSARDAYVEGITSADGFIELLSSEVVEVAGEDVIEVIFTKMVSGKPYRISSITFIHNQKQYNLGWTYDVESDIDYSKDYAAFKKSIVIKEIDTAEVTVLESKEYSIGENTIRFGWVYVDGKEKLKVTATAENEEYGSLIFMGILNEISTQEANVPHYSIITYCDEKFVMLVTEEDKSSLYGINNDGTATLKIPDWFILEYEGYTMSEIYILSLTSEIARITQEFMGTSTIEEGEDIIFEPEETMDDIKRNIVYCDSYVNIYFSSVSSQGVEFWVENLTEYNLTLQADSVSVNGISTNDIIMSDDVAPLSIGKVIVRCDDFKDGAKVKSVGGQLLVIDKKSYVIKSTATFANVTIE